MSQQTKVSKKDDANRPPSIAFSFRGSNALLEAKKMDNETVNRYVARSSRSKFSVTSLENIASKLASNKSLKVEDGNYAIAPLGSVSGRHIAQTSPHNKSGISAGSGSSKHSSRHISPENARTREHTRQRKASNEVKLHSEPEPQLLRKARRHSGILNKSQSKSRSRSTGSNATSRASRGYRAGEVHPLSGGTSAASFTRPVGLSDPQVIGDASRAQSRRTTRDNRISQHHLDIPHNVGEI
eukprot:CAMPEP_0167746434 /NCGR_PEP_ID=MMETSP0110_2-20121227/3710_1 /TAXON_ID=629695 /ORGANISM="Gymnochlora sp., Strain CCMP2014" /LENGTH=240 /DNA_ID=CAMNT_0007631197 /DNA_START=933 /DNA_END=1655 /DNA_ORIENTATION=+